MIIENVNPTKILDEFISNDILPTVIKHNRMENEYIASETYAEFKTDTDMALVQQIIDAHDPTPLPPQPTSEQQLTMEMTMAMAQMQMDNMMAIAELTNLIMAMGGM